MVDPSQLGFPVGGASALSTPALSSPAVICCILFIRSTAALADKTSRHAGYRLPLAVSPDF